MTHLIFSTEESMGDFGEDSIPKKLHSGVWYILLFSFVKIHKN